MFVKLHINRNFLYHFQFHLIEELIDRFQDVKISLKVHKPYQSDTDFRDEKYYRIIDRRFTNFRTNPLTTIELNQLTEKYPEITVVTEFQKEECPADWSVYLFSNITAEYLSSYGEENVLKLNINENYWFQCSIRKQEHTEIEILKLDRIIGEWIPFQTMQFATQRGIYNNRSKALYYSSLLICKSIAFLQSAKFTDKALVVKTSSGVSTISFCRYYLSLFFIIILRKFNRKKLNWKVAIKQHNKFILINQPKDTFWADPFPVLNEDKLLVFIEEYNYATNLGEIALLELDAKLNVKEKHTLIKEDFHLSFPNVFRIGQEHYMMPESSGNSKLCIYKSNEFPNHWTLCSELMSNVKLVDAVWIFHEGLYWIFANKIHNFEADNNECLYLYYSTDLFSNNWQSHRQNPIVVNLSCARNAGQIYQDNGKLYRPSQNCEKFYGAAICINEITELTTEKYSEKVIHTLYPEKPYRGMHTYNKINDLVLLDFLKEE